MGVWRAAARVTAGECALGWSVVGGCGAFACAAASPGRRRFGGMFWQPRGKREKKKKNPEKRSGGRVPQGVGLFLGKKMLSTTDAQNGRAVAGQRFGGQTSRITVL